jgi:hypothetical protein
VKKYLRQRWIVRTLGLPLCLLTMHGSGCGNAPQTRAGQQEAKQPHQAAIGAAGRYDLERDEERGGHTLRRHVGRTEAQLEERLQRDRNISAASTWTDRQIAEETVAEALRAERGHLQSWMQRGYPRANLALHYSPGRPIGRSLRRGKSTPEACREAVIVLRAEGPNSYYVLTAYPEARP